MQWTNAMFPKPKIVMTEQSKASKKSKAYSNRLSAAIILFKNMYWDCTHHSSERVQKCSVSERVLAV